MTYSGVLQYHIGVQYLYEVGLLQYSSMMYECAVHVTCTT